MLRPRAVLLAAPLALALVPHRAARAEDIRPERGSGSAAQWNPMQAAVEGMREFGDAVAGAGRFLGGIVGAPAGGLIEAATTPTIQSAELSGRRLIEDLDRRLAAQVGDVDARLGARAAQVGTVTGALLRQAETDVSQWLAQTDRSLEARILQVDRVTKARVSQVEAAAARSIGLLDDLSRKRIDQVFDRGGALWTQMQTDVRQQMLLADEILAARTEQLGFMLTSSIAQMDRALEERINQLDEVAERRIGTVDVIATKASLHTEAMMLRVAALMGLIAFAAFALWRAFTEFTHGATEALHRHKDSRWAVLLRALWSSVWRGGLQIGAAAGAAVVLYLLAGRLPSRAERRAAGLVQVHERQLETAVQAMDFTRVRYHAAQLALLQPEGVEEHQGQVHKAELLRDVFTRPAMMHTAEGLRALMAKVAEVEALRDGDPDVSVVKGYILWQVAGARRFEQQAAELFARALERPRDESRRDFLRPLAANYLRAFLHNPPPGADTARLRAVADREGPAQGEFPPFQHVFDYDRLAADLDRASSKAYAGMVEAHAGYLRARAALAGAPEPRVADGQDGLTEPQRAVREAKLRRREQARAVVDAWKRFDTGLQQNPWLGGTTASLAAFSLNDAVLSRALWFDAQPDARETAPLLTDERDGSLDVETAVKMAPLRIAWARRYVAPLGRQVADLVSYEEAQRFREYERRAHAFEHAAAAFLSGDPSDAQAALAAAQAAAEMGLYVEGEPYSARLLKSVSGVAPESRAEAERAYGARQLRFL